MRVLHCIAPNTLHVHIVTMCVWGGTPWARAGPHCPVTVLHPRRPPIAHMTAQRNTTLARWWNRAVLPGCSCTQARDLQPCNYLLCFRPSSSLDGLCQLVQLVQQPHTQAAWPRSMLSTTLGSQPDKGAAAGAGNKAGAGVHSGFVTLHRPKQGRKSSTHTAWQTRKSARLSHSHDQHPVGCGPALHTSLHCMHSLAWLQLPWAHKPLLTRRPPGLLLWPAGGPLVLLPQTLL